MEKLFKTLYLTFGICFFSGCGTDKPDEEINLNEEVVEVSTASKKNADSLLRAPGNYIRNTVKQINKTKEAVVIYEKSALEHMANPEESGQ